MSNRKTSRSLQWSLPGVILVASLATLAQSFADLKLGLLAIFGLFAAAGMALGHRLPVYRRLLWFYLTVCVIAVVWAFVGILHNGNPLPAIADALRLYVVWSVAFFGLYSVIRSQESLGTIHVALVTAGILIAVINVLALGDQIAGWGLISMSTSKEMELRVGIHAGYIQITSKNIGPLFLITPYLLSLQFTPGADEVRKRPTAVALILCLFVAAISGRRGLWLVIVLTPCAILGLSWATGSLVLMRPGRRHFLWLYSFVVALGIGWVSLFPKSITTAGYARHFENAFSAEDQRTIERSYLVDAFIESPMLGSGFGGYAGYRRNDQRPWTYELTYYQTLFNLGIVGVTILGGLFGLYFILVLRLLRRYRRNAAIPFGLLLGVCSLFLGAYSNPYLGSFDFLFFAGLLPYLSTFKHGFDDSSRSVSVVRRRGVGASH